MMVPQVPGTAGYTSTTFLMPTSLERKFPAWDFSVPDPDLDVRARYFQTHFPYEPRHPFMPLPDFLTDFWVFSRLRELMIHIKPHG